MRSHLRAIREPSQERSQQSLERILDAAERLIHERGFEALTIGEVVQRSRTSVGTFYARFEDKAALLRAVHDRVLQRLEATYAERLRAGTRASSLRAAVADEVACFVRLVTRDAPLIRAFSGQRDSVMFARASRATRHHFDAFRSALYAHAAEIRHADPEGAIRFAFGVCSNIALSYGCSASTWEGPLVADPTAELSRMLLGYLRGDGEAGAASKRRRR